MTEFYKFPELPPELRLKIWAEVLKQSRILELASGAVPVVVQGAFPDFTRRRRRDDLIHVREPSCLPPAILHVSREARAEGLNVYTLTDFEHQDGVASHRPVYYNPLVDIVLFGFNTHITTIMEILRRDIIISQVAVAYRPMFLKTAGSIVTALSGGESNTVRNGIQRIVFVLSSCVWMEKGYNINPTSCFASTESTGKSMLERQEYAALQRVLGSLGQGDRGRSWTLENMPTFEIKSLAPAPQPGKMFHNIVIFCRVSDKDYLNTLDEIGKKTGCIVKPDPASLQGWRADGDRPAEYEIGFYGTPDQVTKTKQMAEGLFRQASDEADRRANDSDMALDVL